MNERIIEPLNSNIEAEKQAPFANPQAQQLAKIANTPNTGFLEKEKSSNHAEYVKLKILFFFFRFAMYQLIFSFFILSIFIVGIPLLIVTLSFYRDIKKHYKIAISQL
ncbi:MAG: hypothetical protein Q4A21_01020 [bacterium]|nr:hypothetical protein [bacterium]